MELPRDLVIKVRYVESIKRLTSSVPGNNLDVDLAKLRKKLILAFNLSPSADFILTYSDLDGDTIMLDDDEDLRDAVINQKLNPLRINVQLRSQPNVAPVAKPMQNPANPACQGPFNDLSLIGSSLEEVLRSPRHDVLKTPPAITEKNEKNAPPIMKEILTKLSTLEVPQAARPSNVHSESSSSPSPSPASGPKETTTTASANATKTTPASKRNKEPKVVHVFDKGATSGLPTEMGAADNIGTNKKTASVVQQCNEKAVMQNASHKGPCCAPQPGPPPHMRPALHQNAFPKGPFFGPQPGPSPSMHGPLHHPFPIPSFPPSDGKLPPPPPGYDYPVDKPFSSHAYGTADAPSTDLPPYLSRFFHSGHPHRKADGYESTFPPCYRGIACDGCDTTPIVGPRHKSIVKDDYDLCAKCFICFGKQDEYTKFGVPAPSRMPWDFNEPSNLCSLPPVSAPLPVRGSKMRSKFKSRFIQDVTIPDGTIMAPSMPFTKIWRMQNNGSSFWPFGTQLLWIGGDQITDRISFQLEIPMNGFPFDKEIDIGVDFRAPARAGRYLSYWRLATPCGQKFGQKVLVFFKVEQSDSSKQDIKSTMIPKLAPESFTIDSSRDPEMTDVQDSSESSAKDTTSNFCSLPPVSAPFPVRGSKMRSKLKSRFIQDVTIPDGTIMAPSTPFTKIWRMQNNGSSFWPFGTQLLWVGGDRIADRISFQLEIPMNGFSFDKEIDIGVDFRAPARAGRYLSYWRLATPCGQKFGQKVLVFFKVEQSDSSKQDMKSTIIPKLASESFTIDSSRDPEMTDVQDSSESSAKDTTSNFCSLPLVSAPFPVRGSKMRSKLKSRFIQDVTIPDGAIMAPSTPFTKIWRMQNNGSTFWPFGTQLLWVGGDQIADRISFKLEIPMNGFSFDKEIDIGVDFRAPARAGRYLSYWRLATPCGQKFGQKVLVFFKVEQSDSSKQDMKSTIIPKLAPESFKIDSSRNPEMTDVQDSSESSVKDTTSNDGPTLDETQVPVTEPVTNTVNGPKNPIPHTLSYPLVDPSPTPKAVADPAPSLSVLEVTDNNQSSRLKELDEMGLRQIDLNKEVLRLNKYDLEQVVDELCDFSEWDPLLEDLREMGFIDKEKNKKLLV